MRVSHRLLLTLLPSFVGLLTVVGLAYWGQYQRQAPHFAVFAAAITLGVSVVLALRNARHLAHGIERLAAVSGNDSATDELASIERSVEQIKTERTEVARREREAEAGKREFVSLLSDASSSAASAIDEVRLPLHILLENRFGDLNENQEEMLGAAQSAAEDASALMGRLSLVADLERGAVELRSDPLRVDDVIRGLLAMAETRARTRDVRVSADIAPALPRVLADRTYLNEALSILLKGAVDRTETAGEVRIVVAADGGKVRITFTHGTGHIPPLEHALVKQLARAMGVEVTEDPGRTVLALAALSPISA